MWRATSWTALIELVVGGAGGGAVGLTGRAGGGGPARDGRDRQVGAGRGAGPRRAHPAPVPGRGVLGDRRRAARTCWRCSWTCWPGSASTVSRPAADGRRGHRAAAAGAGRAAGAPGGRRRVVGRGRARVPGHRPSGSAALHLPRPAGDRRCRGAPRTGSRCCPARPRGRWPRHPRRPGRRAAGRRGPALRSGRAGAARGGPGQRRGAGRAVLGAGRAPTSTATRTSSGITRTPTPSGPCRLAPRPCPPSCARRLLSLAVFPADTAIPVAAVARYWAHTRGRTPEQTRADLDRLAAANLLRYDGDRSGSTTCNTTTCCCTRPRRRCCTPSCLTPTAPAPDPDADRDRRWWRLPASEPYIWDHLDRASGRRRGPTRPSPRP